jgi:trimeric autotransporter adhesin
VRRHSKASSASSKSGNARLALIVAVAAAFMLVPVAQASAAITSVTIVGTGSGEVSSVGGYEGSGIFEGAPPVECSYVSPGPQTGECESELSSFEGSFGIAMKAIPAPGSQFAGWKVKSIAPEAGFCGTNQVCVAGTGNPSAEGEIIAAFCPEGESSCLGPELTVVEEGTGGGSVVSNPSGIVCQPGFGGSVCKAPFAENTKVTLTASPDADSTFVSWKGCEKGGVNGRQCTVTMDKAKTVNAKFLTSYHVTVDQVGTGLGKVSSSPGGILCLSNCSSTTVEFKEGTSVTLTAAPSKNQVFTEWTGDCSGSSPTCSLGSLGADKTVGAKFTPVAQHKLTLKKSGAGEGTVKSNVAGISCGVTCSSTAAAYVQGTVVELTATPGKGSSFGGWSGAGCSGTGTCTVPMSEVEEGIDPNKTILAEFK